MGGFSEDSGRAYPLLCLAKLAILPVTWPSASMCHGDHLQPNSNLPKDHHEGEPSHEAVTGSVKVNWPSVGRIRDLLQGGFECDPKSTASRDTAATIDRKSTR